ncbi:MAG: sugar ABC transporter substrate-binding protein [Anaerolineales bacterium]|nr:sugar ABC transporter substrate-binding protein [Anaerolineales bacterium]
MYTHWKRFTLILLSVLLLLTSCSTAAPADAEVPAEVGESAEQQEMQIGIMTMGLVQPYFVELSRGYKDMAAEYPGVNVQVLEVDPKEDVTAQVAAIENWTQMGIDAFIITAIDPPTLDEVILAARREGIKVIAHYNLLNSQDLHSGISTYGMGFTAGEMAAEWINNELGGSADVALLIWDKTEFDIDRTEGMRDALSTFSPGAEIVAEAAADTAELGLNAAETILQANPDVKVFVCYNDEGCLGALAAVESAGLASDDFGIFGVNASQEALSKIAEGTVYRGTASIDPYNHGRLEMEMAIRMVMNEFVPSSMEIVPVAVTEMNLDQFYTEE